MKGLDFQTIHIPLIAGLNTKPDPRALKLPSLSIAKNLEFEEPGGFNLRKPLANLGNTIYGGGSLSNLRRFFPNGDELIAFTKDAIYSRSTRDAAWILKGTYYAPKLTEESVFVNTAEQITPDYAIHSGSIFTVWVEDGSTPAIYLGVRDQDTNAVILPRSSVANGTRPRLVPCTTGVLLFYVDSSSNLVVKAITPADPASSIAAAATNVYTLANGFDLYYDAISTGDTAYLATRNTAAQYDAISVTYTLTISRTGKPQACSGPIALALNPQGTRLQVIRANGSSIQGSYISASGFANITGDQAIGTASTTVNQIACCYRSVQDSGAYRCYTFWSAGETSAGGGAGFETEYNWVDTNGTIGTEASLVKWAGVVSRAFEYNGKVFVWVAFAMDSNVGSGMALALGQKGQLQNTYFLYSDDATLHGKATTYVAGGFSAATGRLPQVQTTDGLSYTWCGTERRVVPLGKKKGYSARAPREITITFDSDEARRCVRLGKTVYITGAQLLQYDGEGIVEVGFHIFPWYFDAVSVGGAIAAGIYDVKETHRWDNAKGERERSTTATVAQVTLGAPSKITVSMLNCHFTLKQGKRAAIANEYWRTQKDPTDDAPFFLGTSQNPANSTNPNRYLPNNPASYYTSTFDDNLTDSQIGVNESNEENGILLERLPPPPSSIMVATQDRILLAGIAGNPYEVWYSRKRQANEIASFHDTLRFEVPPTGGKIVALAFNSETLAVFCETAIWEVPGTGFENDGSGQNYGPARQHTFDIGTVRHEAVGIVPDGVMFHSKKGWFLLDHAWQLHDIGSPISDFDDDTFVAITVMDTKHQVRCVAYNTTVLMYDYRVGQWSEWTITDAIDACIWQGTYCYLSSSNIKQEQSSYSTVDYAMDFEFAWLNPADLQGYVCIDEIMVAGEFRSAHGLRVRLARDYEQDGSGNWVYFQDKGWTATPPTQGSRLQMRLSPTIRQVQALKIRITTQVSASDQNPPTGEACTLTSVAIKFGFLPGLFKGLPAAQMA